MNHRKVRAPERTLAVVDHNVPTTDRTLPQSDDPESAHPDRGAGRERPRFRHRILRRLRQAAGHRPHRRARAGLHPAGHDHRLRRQPHLDARRLRRAGARHRHVGGRARARHPDADPAEGQEHAGARRRPAAAAASPPRTSSSPSSARSAPPAATATSSNSPAKRSARCRMEGRMTVCNMTIEGGARAGLIAPDEKTFDYVKGRPRAPKGAAYDMARRLLEDALHRRGRAFRQGRGARRRQAAADRLLGLLARGRDLGHRRRAEPGRYRRREQARLASGGRSTIWA